MNEETKRYSEETYNFLCALLIRISRVHSRFSITSVKFTSLQMSIDSLISILVEQLQYKWISPLDFEAAMSNDYISDIFGCGLLQVKDYDSKTIDRHNHLREEFFRFMRTLPRK